MRYSQVKEVEKRLEDIGAAFGTDSKAYARALEDVVQTQAAWDATPEQYRIIDWQEPVPEVEVEVATLKPDTLYFNAKDGLKEIDTLKVEANEQYAFKYPESDERFMAVTFRDGV